MAGAARRPRRDASADPPRGPKREREHIAVRLRAGSYTASAYSPSASTSARCEDSRSHQRPRRREPPSRTRERAAFTSTGVCGTRPNRTRSRGHLRPLRAAGVVSASYQPGAATSPATWVSCQRSHAAISTVRPNPHYRFQRGIAGPLPADFRPAVRAPPPVLAHFDRPAAVRAPSPGHQPLTSTSRTSSSANAPIRAS
jgi:hypothetical protein